MVVSWAILVLGDSSWAIPGRSLVPIAPNAISVTALYGEAALIGQHSVYCCLLFAAMIS
jgi:hypothetical protein